MAKLIYSMLMSLDGYTEDERGRFGWGAPEDEEVQSYVRLDLDLIEERRFQGGVVALRYGARLRSS